MRPRRRREAEVAELGLGVDAIARERHRGVASEGDIGAWAARALDGKGHHDGDGVYYVLIEVREFGDRFFPGGKARFQGLPPAGRAPPGQTFNLPANSSQEYVRRKK